MTSHAPVGELQWMPLVVRGSPTTVQDVPALGPAGLFVLALALAAAAMRLVASSQTMCR